MELGVRVSLEARESAAGQAVIPARLLLDVVRSLPKDELTLEYRSSHQDVEVVSGPARFHLRTLPTEDFPKLPEAPPRAPDACLPRPSSTRSAGSRGRPHGMRRGLTSPVCS